MPRASRRPQRVPSEWIIRGLLALVAVTAGYYSVTRALGYALRGWDVEAAHRLAPGDGRVAARLAQTLAISGTSAADHARADRFARTALRRDPTAVAAVSALGLDAQRQGNAAAARRLFTYAEVLSRRDLVTQLWAVEDAVGREDVPGALRHYDIALRTSAETPAELFPVLTSAVSDATIRRALVGTLAQRPAWGPGFVDHLALNGQDPRASAQLLTDLRRAGIEVSRRAQIAVIDGLVGSGHAPEAWRYYVSVGGGADRRMSRDPRFVGDAANARPFDWALVDDARAVATIQRGATGGVFDFSVPTSGGGPLLRQLQYLPPGRYRLDGHGIDINLPQAVLPYWTLTCQDGRELGRVPMVNSAQAGGRLGGQFEVPADCPVQTLVLTARAANSSAVVSGQIDWVQLRPMAGANA